LRPIMSSLQMYDSTSLLREIDKSFEDIRKDSFTFLFSITKHSNNVCCSVLCLIFLRFFTWLDNSRHSQQENSRRKCMGLQKGTENAFEPSAVLF
jgi:hypothetical protein